MPRPGPEWTFWLSRPAAGSAGSLLETIFEPIIFRLEPDRQTGGFAVAGDHDILLLGLAQQMRQVVLDSDNGTSFTRVFRTVPAMFARLRFSHDREDFHCRARHIVEYPDLADTKAEFRMGQAS